MNKIILLLFILSGLFNTLMIYYYFSGKVYNYNTQAYMLKAKEDDDDGGFPDTKDCLVILPNKFSK